MGNMNNSECINKENRVELIGDSGIRVVVPESIILNKDLGNMRISIYSYLYLHRGLNNILFFSVNKMLKWMHKNVDRRKGGTNDKVAATLDRLKSLCFISYDDHIFDRNDIHTKNKIWDQFIEIKFNMEKQFKETEESQYTILYWDEILKIINYKNPNKKDPYLNNNVILLVFSFLRLKIKSGIVKSNSWVEACNYYYIDIANEIGISERTVSKCIKILEDIGLIYCERITAKKISDNKYSTGHAIFVNQYKRDGRFLIASGEEYYMNEIMKKYRKMRIKR